MDFDWGGFGSNYGSSKSSSGKKKKGGTDWGDFGSSFATATKQEQEDAASKKRLDELSAIETKKQQTEAAKPGFLEGIGGLAKDLAKGVTANYERIGKGTANVFGELTGVNQGQRDLQESTQDQDLKTIEALNVKAKAAKDPAERKRILDSIKKITSIGDTQDAAFQQDQQRIIQENDPVKAAAATAGIGLDVVTGGTLGAAAKGLKATKVLTDAQKVGKVAKGIGVGSGIGGAYGVTGAVEEKGAAATPQDLLQSAGTGALIGGAIPLAGSILKKTAGEISKASKGSKKANLEATQAAEDAATRTKLTTQPDEVVQVVNPKTGEKTFYRIPKDQRDTIVESIDGTKNGSAGKNVDGNVTHVTARTPEDMAKKGFKDGGVYGDDTVNPVGTAVENVATPAGQVAAETGTKASRYVSKTLPDSDFVGVDTKSKLGADYDATTNAKRADTSLQQLDTEGVDDFATKVNGRLDEKTITDQTVFDAQAAAQALEKRGDVASLDKAADIYNKLSTQLSKAGQTVQAASIMARQTPQGLSYYAQKQFKKAGVELSKDKKQTLNELINKVKEAPPKTDEAIIARDNVQYFIAQNIPSSKADQIVNFWRAGLLTSPTTTGGAIVGNTAQAIQRNLVTDPIATVADLALSLFTKKRTSAASSPLAGVKGAIEGAKVLGNKQYLKTGLNPLDPGYRDGKFGNPRQTNYGDSTLGKVTGTYVNGVYKIMGAADLPFRNMAKSKALSSMARSEAKNNGLKGKEKSDFIKEFEKNPPTEFEEKAIKEAEAAVFGNDTVLGTAAAAASKALKAKGHPNAAAVADFLIPFAKVPSAVATKVITSTPIGTASEIVKQLIKVKLKGEKFDQRAMAKAIGEGTTGVPIIGAGFALGGTGDITGGYPPTQAERDQWEAEGKKPNSIRVGDKWYSLNYIQPFASLLATGAKAREAVDAGLDLGEVINQSIAGTGQSVLSQSFLTGISSAIDAVKDPGAYAGKFVANTAAGIIPNAIRAAASASDPLQRDINGAAEGIIGGIPGLRQNLSPKLDDEGQPVTNPTTFADRYLNPLKPTTASTNEDTLLNNKAIIPAKRLSAVRKKSINELLSKGQVKAAQRKIDEYNQDVAEIIAPYIKENEGSITEDQLDRIEKLFLGNVWINKKGQPAISSRDDLPS